MPSLTGMKSINGLFLSAALKIDTVHDGPSSRVVPWFTISKNVLDAIETSPSCFRSRKRQERDARGLTSHSTLFKKIGFPIVSIPSPCTWNKSADVGHAISALIQVAHTLSSPCLRPCHGHIQPKKRTCGTAGRTADSSSCKHNLHISMMQQ